MPRILGSLILLFSLSAHAADVPLSDRPIGPVRVNTFGVAAGPDAILIAFSSGPDVYAQRLTLSGTPIDEKAFYVGTPGDTPPGLTVFWIGWRWAVRWPDGVAWIDSDGRVEGIHQTQWWNYSAVIDDRLIVASPRIFTDEQVELALAEIATSGQEFSVGTIVAPTGDQSWILGVDRGLGIVSYRQQWADGIYNVTATVTTTSGDSRNYFFERRIPGPGIRFIASRAGGGLFLWNRDGLRGMIVRPDLTATDAFTIGPAVALSGEIVATSRDGGWDVLFRPSPSTHIARISLDGSVEVEPLNEYLDLGYWWKLVSADSANLLLSIPSDGTVGLAVSRIVGTTVGAPRIAAVVEAAQHDARSATGSGTELVVWEEQTTSALVLKASRLVGGQPLDGAGILVAEYGHRNPPYGADRFDVAFDGERFIVAWIEEDESAGVRARAISTSGELSDPVQITDKGAGGVAIAGAGEGRAAVSWWGNGAWLTPLLDGVPGTPSEIGPGVERRSLPRIAASADRYLAVFTEYYDCRITCEPDGHVWAQAFSLGGVPLTGSKRLSEESSFDAEVVSDGSAFFVTWDGRKTLAKITPDLEIVWKTTPVRLGTLSIDEGELRIDDGATRSVYSIWGHLERLEPLPVADRDTFATALADRRVIIRTASHPDRLVIRALDAPGAADIAIVPTGRIEKASSPYGQVAWFRVEHRGGTPVSRLELWSANWIYLPNEPEEPYRTMLVLERSLLPGESFEIGLGTYQPDSSPPIHVAGDAIDLAPANNVAQYGIEERPRRRGTRR